MSDMFSQQWMEGFKDAWNGEADLSGALAKIDFSSSIGYGFADDDKPSGVIVVENGMVTQAGAYNGEELAWDIRASKGDWEKWMKKPPGMMSLGMAYASRKLRFPVGDYAAMVKDPRMAGPFIKSFQMMGTVS